MAGSPDRLRIGRVGVLPSQMDHLFGCYRRAQSRLASGSWFAVGGTFRPSSDRPPDTLRRVVECPSIRPVATHVYPPGERPEVSVLVDHVWHPGELRMWSQHDDGTWWVNVNWSRDGMRHVGSFPADRVRLDKSEWRPDW
jgi:hypothetical protein